MEKKAEKKELKIILGILLTTAVLALIIAVVIVAVQMKPGSILFRGRYDYVDSVMIDGAVVTARDGEYMLVKEGRVISRRYTSMKYRPEYGVYEFTSADGYKGELSGDGKELFRRKITGNEISGSNRTTDVFYYTEDAGVQTVYFGDKSLTLAAGERVSTYESKNLEGLVAGVLLVESTNGDYLTNITGTPRFLLDNIEIHSSKTLVTVADGTQHKSYRLPDLTPLSFLDGALREQILTDTDGNAVLYDYQTEGDRHDITFLNGQTRVSYQIADAPASVLIMKEARVLIVFSVDAEGDPENVGLYGAGEAVFGTYLPLTEELFFIGNQLYNAQSLEPLALTVQNAAESRALRADGKQYLYLNSMLYTFTNGTLSQALGNAGVVSYREFDGKLYFLSGGTLYGNRLNVIIANGVADFVDDNLVQKSGGAYANFAGRTVEHVREVYPVYDFSDRPVAGEYLFLTAAGSYVSFTDTVAAAGFGELERVYRAATGGFLLKTDRGFGAGQTLLRSSAYDGYPKLFGESGIAVVNRDRLDTYQLTARSEFSLTETHYYSNITIQCSELGLVFFDENYLYGYVSKEGKLISGPKYKSVTLTESFVLAQEASDLWQLLDRSGRRLISNRQIASHGVDEYGGYIMVSLSDGKTIMVAQDGSVVSEFAKHSFTIQSFVTDTGDGVFEALPSVRLLPDESAVYEVFLFAEGMQILKISL